MKAALLNKLAYLAQALEDLNEVQAAQNVDGILQAIAAGEDIAGVVNDEEANQMMELETGKAIKQPSQQQPQRQERSVLKIVSKGITIFPQTVKQLKRAIQQYKLNAYDVVQSILRSINLTMEEKSAGPLSLDYAIKLAVSHGLLQDSWF